jgi:proton-dependent oligopeptide transporter, POT family
MRVRFSSSFSVLLLLLPPPTGINVGALLGITMLPIIAQWNVTFAYVIPVVLLATALALFLSGSSNFVIGRPVPRRHHSATTATRCWFGGNNRKNKRNQGTSMAAVSDDDDIPLSKLFRISLLIVPFCMAYSQMPTTLIVQGTVMTKAFGFLDAATINMVDALSVLVFGYLTATYLYPALSRHNVELYTTHKFALGSFLGALSILWALVVDYMIRSEYDATRQHISVLWQAPSYILIGCGEIFAVSAAYEVAFTASSPQTKALASAINIFCVGGIPNLLCVALYHACRGWFRNAHDGTANISHLEQYVTARVDKYFWVLVTILALGIGLNLTPRVRDFVQSIEKRAEEIVKTPLLLKQRPPTAAAGGETTPLLRKQFLQAGPSLYRASSIHAGPSRGQQPQRSQQQSHNSNDPMSSSQQQNKQKMIKASYIQRLYKPMNNNSRQQQQIFAPLPQQQAPATPKRHQFTLNKTHHQQQQQQQKQPHASSLERGDSM